MVTDTGHFHVLETATVLLAISSIGFAIKCFQCNSAEYAECADLKVNDTDSRYYRDCIGEYEGHAPFCRKIFTRLLDVDGSSRISRSCGWLQNRTTEKNDLCRKLDTDFIIKRHCECFSDACNSSDRMNPSFLSLLVVASSYYSYVLNYTN